MGNKKRSKIYQEKYGFIDELGLDNIVLSIPESLRKGIHKKREARSIHTAYRILHYITEQLEVDSLENIRLLDFGCGVKFTQAIMQFDMQIKHYYGVDVDVEMLSFLKEKINYPNFEYELVDFYNEFYNTDGEFRILPDFKLGCKEESFDLITLQSVFTHFGPEDVQNCMKMLRKYLAPGGKMIFTCYVSDGIQENYINVQPDKPMLLCGFNKSFFENMIDQAQLSIDKYNKQIDNNHLADHYICSKK